MTDVPPGEPPSRSAAPPPGTEISGEPRISGIDTDRQSEAEATIPAEPTNPEDSGQPMEEVGRPWLKWSLGALGWVAIAVALFIMWPSWLGGHMTLVQVSGTSMEPTFQTRDVLITWERDEYDVGDIVVYDPEIEGYPDANITHRVIKRLKDGTYVTQGDNRDTADDFRPTAADIKGEVVLVVPTSKVPFAAKANVWAVIFCALIAGFCVFKIITMGGGEDEQKEGAMAPPPEDVTPPAGL